MAIYQVSAVVPKFDDPIDTGGKIVAWVAFGLIILFVGLCSWIGIDRLEIQDLQSKLDICTQYHT